MAHTKWSELAVVDGKRLHDCTPQELGAPDQFYGEDLKEVFLQDNIHTIAKKMATFWGRRNAVWVALDSNGDPLQAEALIALKCPPYYPPDTQPGMFVLESDKPAGFPNSEI
jgi:hypothetical protein